MHREGHVKAEAETGVRQPQNQNASSQPKLEGARKTSSLEPLEANILTSDFWSPGW